MSFDITKTETFVPFLWILLKTAAVLTIFSLFSEHAHRTGSSLLYEQLEIFT